MDDYYKWRGETRLQRLDRKYGVPIAIMTGVGFIAAVIIGFALLIQALVTPVSYDIPGQFARIVDSCQFQNGSLEYNFISCLLDAGVGFTINGDPVEIKGIQDAD